MVIQEDGEDKKAKCMSAYDGMVPDWQYRNLLGNLEMNFLQWILQYGQNSQEREAGTGNSTQYSVITYMGKEFEKEGIYVYV